MKLRMAFDSKQDLIDLNLQINKENNFPSNKDVILCNHCKRTTNNGIRCMGICVADNEY